MKKKFNPAVIIAYKRTKALYDKAVSDLVIETQRADDNYTALADVTIERDSLKGMVDHLKSQENYWIEIHNAWLEKVKHKDAKLKSAGHMVGRLLKERVQLQDDVDFVKAQLVADQRQLVVVKGALLTERDAQSRHLKQLGNASGKIHAQLEELRNVCCLHRAARTRAERSLTSALADVQALKAAKRKWEIGAGIAVGLVSTGVIKLYQMGLI